MTKRFVTIGLGYTESEIRQEIHELLSNAGLKTLANKDFKLRDVNGSCILNKKEGSKFNGRIIKQVVGAGDVYIRLLKHATDIF